MGRLIRSGSMFVGLGQGEKEKGRKEGRAYTVPPRLSLSAGFTWIGLFICDRERGRQREESQERKKRQRNRLASCTHVIAHAFTRAAQI